jgi:hypothetical protein
MSLHISSFLSTFFWVLNFWGCFEALNDVFWPFGALNDHGLPRTTNNLTSRLDISNKIFYTPNEDCMQKLCPTEVYVSTNHLRSYNHFGPLSPRVKVLDI